nr:MAG TPA: hypothetical protein [Caudoviricetes sp.]
MEIHKCLNPLYKNPGISGVWTCKSILYLLSLQ